MVNSYNFLNPMNQSVYLEADYPLNKQDVLNYMESYTPPKQGASLKPQPTKDSWYYNNDGKDDGKISFNEKFKAFIKGGTYNVIKGMFFDQDGFSLSRTLGTAAIATAIAFSGPIGAVAAGAIGLIAGAGKFVQAVQNAKSAVTDTQAREAYERVGEGTSISALSLFGGFKGINAIKQNFAFAKNHPDLKVAFTDRFTKWNVSKHATAKPTETEPTPASSHETPIETVTETETTTIETPTGRTTGTTETTSGEITPPPTENAEPIEIPKLKGWEGDVRKINVNVPEDVEFIPDTAPLFTHPDPIGTPNSQYWLP